MMWWYVQTAYFIPTARLMCEALGFPMWNRSVSTTDRGDRVKKKKKKEIVLQSEEVCFKTKLSSPRELSFTTALQQLCSAVRRLLWAAAYHLLTMLRWEIMSWIFWFRLRFKDIISFGDSHPHLMLFLLSSHSSPDKRRSDFDTSSETPSIIPARSEQRV